MKQTIKDKIQQKIKKYKNIQENQIVALLEDVLVEIEKQDKTIKKYKQDLHKTRCRANKLIAHTNKSYKWWKYLRNISIDELEKEGKLKRSEKWPGTVLGISEREIDRHILSNISNRLEFLENENKKLSLELKELKRQYHIACESNHKKNIELDLLGKVWCSGACQGGTFRYHDLELTEEQVIMVEKNTKRLRRRFENIKGKKNESR